jgi:hypothetical protein
MDREAASEAGCGKGGGKAEEIDAGSVRQTVALQIPWTLFDLRDVLCLFDLFEQAIQVQPPSEHRQLSFRRPRPLVLRSVPIKLDSILVGIT